MKVRTQYDLDPDVQPEDPLAGLGLELEHDLDAPDDSYTIGARGNTVKAPQNGADASTDDDAPKSWVKPLAIALAITFVGLTVWNVNRVIQGPPTLPKPSATQVKQTLYLGVMRVELFRRTHGTTPDTLTEAGLPVSAGYTYQRVDSTRYVLAFENGGPKLEYDSIVPKGTFFGSPGTVLSMRGTE